MSRKDDHAPASPPSARVDAPAYFARFVESRALESKEAAARSNGSGEAAPSAEDGTPASLRDGVPLYLRTFRARQSGAAPSEPLFQRAPLGVQQALTEDNRNKEIAPPSGAGRTVVNDVYLIRHGETQGYSTDSGLTPQGSWQARTYGNTLAKRIKSGETVVFRHAATNRARETAQQIHLGLVDGLQQYEKEITIVEPEPLDLFRNFQFASPSGLKDVTAAFRHYQSQLEAIERTALGDRPLWLVEMDRFWRTQQGGADPIQHWLTIPMLHFEPPSMCVRRFWAGINGLADEFPGARLAIATHSGPIRAFAVAALGYDPGEPYNTEHVRVKLLEGRNEAAVAYRNRVQEVRVPDIDKLPTWSATEEWPGLE